METTGNTTVLMLGVAGMGLAAAMFIDAVKMKQPIEKDDTYNFEPIDIQDTEPKYTDTPMETIIEEDEKDAILEQDIGEAIATTQPISEQSVHADPPNEVSSEAGSKTPHSDHTEESCDTCSETSPKAPSIVSSKASSKPSSKPSSKEGSRNPQKHKQRLRRHDASSKEEQFGDYKEFYRKKKDEIQREYIEQQPDNSYKGDGSAWSKRMYFIKEAYRRSRQQNPVVYKKYNGN